MGVVEPCTVQDDKRRRRLDHNATV